MLPVSIRGHVTTRFLKVFKTLPEVFQRGKMDFFRESSPPNFISFCLDNQNSNETQTPSNPVLEIPAESSRLQVPTRGAQLDTPTEQDSGQLNFATLVTSPGSFDSQPDVNV